MKKKVKIILAFVIMVLPIVFTAEADTDALSVDLLNTYDNMELSYMDGYSPQVAGNNVRILLPLISESEKLIDNERIKVTFDIGTTGYTAFYRGNYMKYFRPSEYAINGTDTTQNAYLIDYSLPLLWNKVNGSYPVEVKVEYSVDGEEQSQQFVVYVDITTGTDKYEYKSDIEPKSRDKHSAPDIIISEYSYSQDIIQAGDEFQLFLTLENTSDIWHAHNIRMDWESEKADLISTDSMGSIFIDELENKEKTGVVLNFRARQDAEAGTQKITIKLSYEDNMNTACTSEDSIIAEIQQPIRLVHDDISIPSSVNAGDSMPISMQVFNMGKSTVYNVLVSVAMPGVIPDGASYLGNMESGDKGTAEIYAFFGTLDMGEYGLETDYKYGMSAGTVTVYYEDEFGEAYTEIIDVKTYIERPVFDDLYNKDEEKEEEPDKMGTWWLSIGILIVIAAFVIGITSYRRKINQLKREYGHLDD
ncbi:MAG: hypothetical protein JXN65_08460 [Clostridia bacterium]|nr:hypothetical protein [Clostridia bacterium]